MVTRHTPCSSSPSAWRHVCEAMDGVPTPSRANPTPSPLVLSGGGSRHSDVEKRREVSTLAVVEKESARLHQEQESDRHFFADPPDDYVRCPTCHIVYAVQMSRPTTPSDIAASVQPMLPASYSKDLPRGANLNLEHAMRHMHRSRFRCGQCDVDFCRCGVSPYHWGYSCDGWQRHKVMSEQACPVGSCRWCSQPCMAKMRRSESLATSCCGSDEGTDLKRFPPSLSCAEKERRACGKRHSACGHWCGGVRGEERCLPCLHSDCGGKASSSSARVSDAHPALSGPSLSWPPSPGLKLPDAEEWCPICWTEPYGAAPSVRLACGHVMHHHCAEALVRKGPTGGRRLTFKGIRCPLCKAIMQHASIDALVSPQFDMYQKVRRKSLQRWAIEARKPAPRPHDAVDEDRIATLAMSKMAFFECSQCNEPYYGGEVECGGGGLEQQQEEEEDLDEDVQAALAMELVCRGCASKGQLQCPEHGVEFLGWKCRYCCEREAHYFCFGTTHFCYVCHDLWQTGVEQRRKLQAGKPCLGKDRCIFGGRHPSSSRNGRDEYALGCTICAQDTECGILVNRERQAARRRFSKYCSVM
mmetsp:Transcript_100667/g.217356  ORF Transcript_100667/g.217356 Transcript_100667/m.217356 type:complete len:585 (-) Transcript_100667:138-1892(-)